MAGKAKAEAGPTRRPRVGLFVTCIVDLFRPTVGWAAVKLLQDAGCEVVVPAQTCCGQPAYNSGDRAAGRRLAEPVIAAFEGFDYVVAPSGSCAGHLRTHYPALFADDPAWAPRAAAFAAKCHELVSFLTDIRGVIAVDAALAETVTYHDSCSGLRELGIRDQPRRLLRSMRGVYLSEMEDPEACCGFGGLFCVKYPEAAGAIATDKARQIAAAGATTVLAGDLGCLLTIAGTLSRQGSPIAVRHVAEVLAGMTDRPPIGAGRRPG